MRNPATMIGGLALVALAGLALATTTAEPEGARLYREGEPGVLPCFGCHGVKGGGVGVFPRLAGLPARYVMDQMQAYRTGARTNEAMQAVAKPLSDRQMRALAEYVEAEDAPIEGEAGMDRSLLAAGARLVTLGDWARRIPACSDCHGPALRGGGPALPALAGQPAGYLEGQLRAFRSGERPGGPLDIMARIARSLDDGEIEAVAAYVASLSAGQQAEIPRGERIAWKPQASDPESYEPPPEDALPSSQEDAAAVLLGERIFQETPRYAAAYVGNEMSCRNCHIDRGRFRDASPMWAAVPQYPKYRSKNRRVNTLEMRIQGCFRYSQNGAPPPADSEEMVALVTYMHWLAGGLPLGVRPAASGYPRLDPPAEAPDRERGREVYRASCTVCHGDDGQGSVVAGARVIPPLWGPLSFNWGAGMHELDKAAAFIARNMPHGAAGVLSGQEAWDVAAWIDSQPRPQDPRFTESVERTRELFHTHRDLDFYGATVDGRTLGAPGTLEAWESDRAPDPRAPGQTP